MFSSQDILDVAIKIEQNGESVYRKALTYTKNPSLSAMLNWIADQEFQHAESFESLKRTLKVISVDPEIENMGRDLLMDSLGTKNFSLKEADFSSAESINDLLRIASDFEKDTIIFYELLKNFVEEDDAQDLLEKIILEETRHVEMLEGFLEGKTSD
jgi:rubrerythrin